MLFYFQIQCTWKFEAEHNNALQQYGEEKCDRRLGNIMRT